MPKVPCKASSPPCSSHNVRVRLSSEQIPRLQGIRARGPIRRINDMKVDVMGIRMMQIGDTDEVFRMG